MPLFECKYIYMRACVWMAFVYTTCMAGRYGDVCACAVSFCVYGLCNLLRVRFRVDVVCKFVCVVFCMDGLCKFVSYMFYVYVWAL